MGLFDFLNPKKKQTPIISVFAKSLSVSEKAAIAMAMFLIVNQHGKRQAHPAEIKFIESIKRNILAIDEREVKALFLKSEVFDLPGILKAMSERDRKYFGFVFYELSTITRDPKVYGLASHIVKDMGFSMEEVAKGS